MASLDIDGLAARLRHSGIPCEVACYGDQVFDPRVRLTNGLSVMMDPHGGFEIAVRHGFDPLTDSSSTECGHAADVFSLPQAIREAEGEVAGVRSNMLGENRDVLGAVHARIGGWRYVPPTVLSESPVQGALAVSMRGMAFSAWLDDVRLSSISLVDEVYRLHWHGDARPKSLSERYLSVDTDGVHLTVVPLGVGSMRLEGVLRTSAGDIWYHDHFNRRVEGERVGWVSPYGRGECLTDDLASDEKEAVTRTVLGLLEPLHERHFDAFAATDVRKRQRDVENFQRRASQAGTRQERLDALHREHSALQDLEHAEAVRKAGYPFDRERGETFEEIMMPSLGGLRLVHARESADRELS